MPSQHYTDKEGAEKCEAGPPITVTHACKTVDSASFVENIMIDLLASGRCLAIQFVCVGQKALHSSGARLARAR